MPTFTKTTTCTILDNLVIDPMPGQWIAGKEFADNMHSLRDAKLQEMVLAEKTDGVETVISLKVTKRSWVDLAAAEEWKAFSFQLQATLGVILIDSITIEDII
jgi:hypothetical protein